MNFFFLFFSAFVPFRNFSEFISFRLFDSRISFTCTNRWKIFFAFILPAFTFSFLRNEHFRFPYDFFYIFVTANIISASNSSTFRLHVQLGCVMFCREKSFFGTFRSILFGFWRFTLLTTFPNIFLNNPFLKFSAKYFHVGAAFISSNIQDVWIFFVQTFFLSSFLIKNTRPVQEMCLHHSRVILWMNSGQKKHRRMQSCRLGERLLRERLGASTHASGIYVDLKFEILLGKLWKILL